MHNQPEKKGEYVWDKGGFEKKVKPFTIIYNVCVHNTVKFYIF